MAFLQILYSVVSAIIVSVLSYIAIVCSIVFLFHVVHLASRVASSRPTNGYLPFTPETTSVTHTLDDGYTIV